MQNEMLGVEEAMNIEVGAVKTETVEVESELFGIVLTRGPTIKCADTDETVNRTEGYNVENWRNEFEIHNTKVKLEEDVNCEEVKIEVEEVIVKHEIDDLKDANGEIAQIRIKKEQVVKDWKNNLKMQDTKVELEEDVNYGELKIESEELIIKDENVDLNDANGEIDVNRSLEMTTMQNQHLKTKDKWACTHCNTVFKGKLTMDDHIVRMHPDPIVSGSSKIHECTLCIYKTTVKSCLDEHVSQHHKTEDSYKLKCVQCDTIFKRKTNLDEHVARKHPNCVASVSNKIHRCAYCTYQTIVKSKFARHMLKHPADSYKLSTCVYCNATFKNKQALDGHMLKKHPDSIRSISTKMHECTLCAFKTVKKGDLDLHMLKHPETAENYGLKTCIHCKTKFKHKANLDDHILKKHPEYIASVSSKVHKCEYCSYKTTKKDKFIEHMTQHDETADGYKLRCDQCEALFTCRTNLDDHIVKKHPNSIALVSNKIHQCKHCTYQTVIKSKLARHMFEHQEIADSYKLSTCIHCNATFKSERALENHTLRKHSDSPASISSKIYKCADCAFKTVRKADLARHSLEHAETAGSYKFSTCIHCNAKYKYKIRLDEHILRQHPEYIVSVSSKIYECPYCAFNTVIQAHLARHLSKHPFSGDSYKFSTCVSCNATFKGKQAVDDHTLSKHPDSIGHWIHFY
ncbi:unnamed protein product [Callosobruchus maculatus]|uniref:C2H2-type domain-containing protein n=1 Tax=Callosobruchus maculatus TaxID=64391 RepID=A0A653CTZ4_CALMS|nr:unnamed protein product [Callosobruchus maculatus]